MSSNNTLFTKDVSKFIGSKMSKQQLLASIEHDRSGNKHLREKSWKVDRGPDGMAEFKAIFENTGKFSSTDAREILSDVERWDHWFAPKLVNYLKEIDFDNLRKYFFPPKARHLDSRPLAPPRRKKMVIVWELSSIIKFHQYRVVKEKEELYQKADHIIGKIERELFLLPPQATHKCRSIYEETNLVCHNKRYKQNPGYDKLLEDRLLEITQLYNNYLEAMSGIADDIDALSNGWNQQTLNLLNFLVKTGGKTLIVISTDQLSYALALMCFFFLDKCFTCDKVYTAYRDSFIGCFECIKNRYKDIGSEFEAIGVSEDFEYSAKENGFQFYKLSNFKELDNLCKKWKNISYSD